MRSDLEQSQSAGSVPEPEALRLLTSVDAVVFDVGDAGCPVISAKGLQRAISAAMFGGWLRHGLVRPLPGGRWVLTPAGRDRAAELFGRPYPALTAHVPWAHAPPGADCATSALLAKLASSLAPGVVLYAGLRGRPWTLERRVATGYDLLAYVPEPAALAAVNAGLVVADQRDGPVGGMYIGAAVGVSSRPAGHAERSDG